MTDSKTTPDAALPGEQPRITARVAGRSLYMVLRPYAVGYFFATLGCDLLFFATQDGADRVYSVIEFGLITEWLLAAGLLLAVVANIAAFIDFCGERQFSQLVDLGLYAGGNVLIVILGACNLWVRLAGTGEDVMEAGLVLSLTTILVMVCIPSKAWNRLYH